MHDIEFNIPEIVDKPPENKPAINRPDSPGALPLIFIT